MLKKEKGGGGVDLTEDTLLEYVMLSVHVCLKFAWEGKFLWNMAMNQARSLAKYLQNTLATVRWKKSYIILCILLNVVADVGFRVRSMKNLPCNLGHGYMEYRVHIDTCIKPKFI